MQGRVEDGEGAIVALVPQDDGLRNAQLTYTTTVESSGGYQLKGLRPGDYYAYAFDSTAQFELDLLEDARFVRNLIPHAVNVRIDPGSTNSIDLKITPWQAHGLLSF